MNKSQLVARLTKFIESNNYEMEDAVVSHGGAMVLLGLRDDTNDVDIYVTEAIWNDFLEDGFKPDVKKDGIESIQATKHVSIRINTRSNIYPDVITNRVNHQSAEQTLHEYQLLNRDKDAESIVKLQNYIEG
jgi:hypothetical protein